MSDNVWTIELLGWLRLVRGHVAERPLSQKTSVLLAWLATNDQTAHAREELATMLWPEATPAAGRHRLRTALYDLRRLLEPAPDALGSVVSADRESVRLVPGSFVTDVALFSAAVGAAAASAPESRADALRRALDLYRGELLPGFFEPWVLAERRRLAAIHVDLLGRLVEALAESDRAGEAIDAAHRLVACDPLDEDAQLVLMRLYARQGRAGAALEQYRTFAALLQEELGVPPPEAMADFARSLRRDAPPAGGPAARVSRLPTPLTRFVGREEELRSLHALLVEGAARLVTVVGAGGIGKTRLASEFARIARASAGAAVTYVELADVVDETFVVDSVAATAGVVGLEGDDPLDEAAAALAGRDRPLLVVDNAERVAESVASVAQYLLSQAPALRVLVTSRRPLAVPGEVELRLAPLATPAGWEHPDELAENPSVAMYVDRVRTRRSDFTLTAANAAAVARLCTRLEGIPLALELAAVRERVLPASQLVGRLEKRFEVLVGAQRDVPERHRTLSAAIDWSYHALGPVARNAFARLSVFRGGWSLDDAAAICATADADTALERMCDVSLLETYDRAGTRRFRMLETIREFALELLAPEERDELRRRHAGLFLALAERAHGSLSGPDQAEWLERLDADFDNVRAALDWSLRAGDVETALRIGVALHRYWVARSRMREARRWFREALSQNGDRLPLRLLRRGLRIAGELALFDGDLGEARRSYERAAALGSADDDPETTGYILGGRGHLAARHGEFGEARDLLLSGLEIAVTGGLVELRACLANDLGVMEAKTGNYGRALEHFVESLESYRQLRDDTSVVVLLYNLGYLATITGEFDRAEAFLTESVATCRRLGHESGVAIASTFLGLLDLRRLRPEEAVGRCAEAVTLCLEIGEYQRMVLAIEGLGCALAALGRFEAATRVLGHASALRKTTDAEALFEDAGVVMRVVDGLRKRLGEAACDRLVAAGREASTEEVLADAVSPA